MKKLTAITAATIMVLSLAGCNKQVVDLNYSFDKAIILLPNGEVVEGKVETWKDYEGEQVQVKIDGVTYLVSSVNAVLIKGAAD